MVQFPEQYHSLAFIEISQVFQSALIIEVELEGVYHAPLAWRYPNQDVKTF